MKSPSVQRALETLRANGYHVTAQRRLLLEVLDAAQDHLDADALYQRARARDPSISLATVYRTLNVLLDAGLVQQRFLNQDRSRAQYELSGREHFHFTCQDCGRVIEFETNLVAQICRQLRSQYGLLVRHVVFHVEGVCEGHAHGAPCPADMGVLKLSV